MYGFKTLGWLGKPHAGLFLWVCQICGTCAIGLFQAERDNTLRSSHHRAAVLVAIAIPVFTQQLEKSREATDSSNIRAAYAEVMTDALVDSKTDSTRTVALKQQVDDWQNAEDKTNLESLAVTEDAAKGKMGVEVNLSGVGNGKSVTVTYDADGGTGGLGKVSIAVAGGTTS